MSNAKAHKVGAAIVVGVSAALIDDKDEFDLTKLAFASSLAYTLGRLPDIIEPATSPNHRQFFHSYTFFVLLGVGMLKAHQWKPETEYKKLARYSLLIAGGAYATHLLMDSTTPKGLPII